MRERILRITKILPPARVSIILVLFSLVYFSPEVAFAISEKVKQLVEMETLGNATAVRSPKPVVMEHYEIPLELLEADVADRTPPEVKDALIFEKNGKKYVRWIVNPEDTKFRHSLRRFLKNKKARISRVKYFKGYQTASRSYIVEDPKSGAQFSLKVSTNKTGGMWKDKKQTAVDTRDVRLITDYVQDVNKKMPFENFVVMDEPAAFKIGEIDQGMIVRLLGDLPDGKFTYVPGFSAVNHNVGIVIARANGSLNPAEFWNNHYNKPLGRALAELAAKTGVTYDSPHSQNFLVEFDENLKPTGRIVLRDLGDSFLVGDIVEAHGRKDITKLWEAGYVRKQSMKAYVGIFHGTPLPGWMDEEKFTKWGKDFFEAYNSEYSTITGIPRNKLPDYVEVSERYLSMNYDLKGEAWDQHLDAIKNAKARKNTEEIPWRAAARCQKEFAKVKEGS